MRTLKQLEAVIEKHLGSFIEVGHAFKDIRDGTFIEMNGIKPGNPKYQIQLTKVLGHPTLAEYWQVRWSFTIQRVNQLIDHSELMEYSSETAVSKDIEVLSS